jgi:site-specific recombinase XerD
MADLVPDVIPSFEPVLTLVTDGVHSPHTKRAYRAALTEFLLWCRASERPTFSRAAVQAYWSSLNQRNLAASTIQVQLSAIRRLAAEMADNGLLDPQSALAIGKVRGPRRVGVRLGNWLALGQAEEMLALPDTKTIKGKRDRAILSVLLGAGLRRAELCALQFDHLQQREGRWVIVDLIGKHDRIRTVPIPAWSKAAVDTWAWAAQLSTGPVFRPLNKSGRVVGSCLTPQSIYHLVRTCGERLGVRLAPHDCRRSFAKLAHKGRAALEQIQIALGHESSVTTERYLGVRQDLLDAPCDHLGIHPDKCLEAERGVRSTPGASSPIARRNRSTNESLVTSMAQRGYIAGMGQ